jgi:hypothetical protein
MGNRNLGKSQNVRPLHLPSDLGRIVRLYRLTLDTPARNVQPHYNICPTDPVDVVVSADGKRSVVPMRWGLIPGWWSKPLKEMKLATFNARAESVAAAFYQHFGFAPSPTDQRHLFMIIKDIRLAAGEN